MSQNEARTLVKLVDDFSSLNSKLKSWYSLSDKTKTYDLINALYRSNYKPTPTADLITGIVTTDSLLKAVANITKEQVGLTAWWNYISGSATSNLLVSDLVDKLYTYYNEEATAATRFVYINGTKLNPMSDPDYYFNSNTSVDSKGKLIGKLALDGLHEYTCEGYRNLQLSSSAFEILIDSAMEIIGIMYYDELGDNYVPLGSGDYMIDELITYTLHDGFKYYTLSDIGKAQAKYQIKLPTQCIVVTKNLDS